MAMKSGGGCPAADPGLNFGGRSDPKFASATATKPIEWSRAVKPEASRCSGTENDENEALRTTAVWSGARNHKKALRARMEAAIPEAIRTERLMASRFSGARRSTWVFVRCHFRNRASLLRAISSLGSTSTAVWLAVAVSFGRASDCQ